ncbi:MAG: HDOD domain-containing protein [Syntrophales bacterium]|jgi:hypothetical protein|nr:HDOD domain-containing protein [Syntrophales bacterium]NLN59321.1 HDOD domain-containing protein [Deltaproteobacteria bacterium]
MDDARAFQLIDEIDAKLMELVKDQLFDPDIFIILDNLEADRRAINAARDKIGEALWLRLHDIAGSVYTGNLRRGEASTFYDVISRLGTQQTKVMIMQIGFQLFANWDPEAERLFARSFATSVMAGILAWQMGFRGISAQRAELGGLFLEIGRQMMALYKKTIEPESEEIDETFTETYHPYLAVKIIKQFGLPDFLQTIVLAQTVILEEKTVSLPGVIYLARDMVRASFLKYGNRFVLRCHPPRPGTDVSRTLEAMIRDKFHAAGLDNYLILLRSPRIHEL